MNGVKLGYLDIVHLRVFNQSYFSSTAPTNKPFLPRGGINFVFTNLEPLSYSSFLGYGRIYTSYAESVSEAPLLYSNWHYNSTNQTISEYLQYNESQELPYKEGLQPEHHRKWEYGASFNLFDYRLGVEFAYSDKLTGSALIPVFNTNAFELSNKAAIQNKAYEDAEI
jgi:hypothetical protein